jgi:hypothetical protein
MPPPPFCTGYHRAPFTSLVADVPGADVFPAESFRLEWGPIFHRGRLDGTARVLILGQDPGASEAIARRILVGQAGQRVQGLVKKLGLVHEYVALNAFVYSVYGQHAADAFREDENIAAYRNRWLDAVLRGSRVDAVIAFGRSADVAFRLWKEHAGDAADGLLFEKLLHPTFPDAAAGGDEAKQAELTKELLDDWNDSLGRLVPHMHGQGAQFEPYGDALQPQDLPSIPPHDLPAGIPAWMRSPEGWAQRTGADAKTKRRTITVTIPASFEVG